MTSPVELASTTNAAADPKYTQHAVTVAHLREMLAGQPDDAIVVLAKNAEGNGYSPLSPPIDAVWYVPDSTWSGEVYPIGPDPDGGVYEPDGRELYAVVLDPVD